MQKKTAPLFDVKSKSNGAITKKIIYSLHWKALIWSISGLDSCRDYIIKINFFPSAFGHSSLPLHLINLSSRAEQAQRPASNYSPYRLSIPIQSKGTDWSFPDSGVCLPCWPTGLAGVV
mmetsp:Transcript_2309/g.4610  ORF Transcript_2309/g.4610 Transcript_2309/m.4610 type:complete len:119 (+) Transcript_2309:213-569(+)